MRRIEKASDEFQLLQALLTNRAKRHRRGEALVTGVRPIDIAIEHGHEVRALLTPAERELSRWANGVIAACRDATRIELSPALFAALAQKDEPADLLAVVAIPRASFSGLAPDVSSIVVVLDRPANPGNLGTIIRTCDAFGVDSVIVTGHAADPYDPLALRASTGSVFALPVVTAGSVDEVRSWVEAGPWRPRVIGTDESGVPLSDAPLHAPLVLLFGNETRGLSRASREWCDVVAGIPITGSVSSLNVATAAGIVLYEVTRRR